MKSTFRSRARALVLLGSSFVLLMLVWSVLLKHRETKPSAPSRGSIQASGEAPVAHPPDAAEPGGANPAISPANEMVFEVEARPLPVVQTSATHEWTAADAREPDVIERIAHNPDEMIKMVEENDRIFRRQLVYRNDTVAAVMQRARLSGEPVSSLILPGLDGHEIEFEIVQADLAPSGQSGSFTGRVAGRPESMVTLAFQFGREAFTVLSPEDGLYLQADPREPGEIIVKSIDPATYAPGTCGTPDYAAGD